MNVTSSDSHSYAVDVQSLSRTFRGVVALDDVTLRVPVGSVFGLVGLNGAGKTTLIRHVIGSMRPLHGDVKVLGRSPSVEPEKLLSRVGYMTEEDSLPTWMRVSDLLQFCRTVYPTWSDAYAAELCETFELSPNAKLKSLSKGGRARAALLAAIGHRPELLILDEPSSGLDPIARADILEAIIRATVEEGRTVLFSSHLLDEIDRVCDSIALIHHGRLLQSTSSDAIATRFRQVLYRTDRSDPTLPALAGAFGVSITRDPAGSECSLVLDLERSESPELPLELTADATAWTLVDQQPASIHQWFAAHVQSKSADSEFHDTTRSVNVATVKEANRHV